MYEVAVFEELRGLIDTALLWGIVGGLAWSAIFEAIQSPGGSNQ